MATTSPNIKQQAAVPFWRDVRVLGIIGQLVVTALVLLGLGWLISNFITNAENQGLQIHTNSDKIYLLLVLRFLHTPICSVVL